MQKILLLGVFLFQLSWAYAQNDFFTPLREGESYYELSNSNTQKIINQIGEEEASKRIETLLNKAFNDELEVYEVVDYTRFLFEDVLKNCRVKSRCERKKLDAIYLLARKYEKIDDVFLFLLQNFLENRKNNAISLVSYYYKLEFTKNLREEIGGDTLRVTENLFNNGKEYLKKEKGYGRLTPRQRLFLFYSEAEIDELTKILRRFLNRNFSTESYLIFELENGEQDRVDLSETEKYKAAVKLFDRELNRAYQDKKISRYPLYSDMLALGLETGVISHNMLNEMLKLPEIQDPYTPFWKKVGLVAYRIGRTVLMINPTTSLYAMTAFLVIDSVRQLKEENEKVSDDHLF